MNFNPSNTISIINREFLGKIFIGSNIQFRRILFWLGVIIGYYCWFQAMYNNLKYGSIYPYESLSIAFQAISTNFIAIAVVFLLNLAIVFRPSRPDRTKYKILIDLILSFISTILLNYLYLFIANLYRDAVVDWAGTLLNNVLIFLLVEGVYYFLSYRRTRMEAEEASHKAMQYRYDALKAQINPHFLFNSLSLLSSLLTVDPEKSKKFILGLASIYRYIMARENEETTPIGKELEFLTAYVSVLETRYNNKFSVTFVGEAPHDAFIIPYTLQLLIENVTKHNVISSKYPMTVIITMDRNEIIVSNPIRLRKSVPTGGIGLKYLTQLYEARGKKFRTENNGTSFAAYIPYLSE